MHFTCIPIPQILRRLFNSLYIANNGYDRELTLGACQRNLADLISFGRLYIANPNLLEHLRIGGSLSAPDRAAFFGGGATGYTDYPVVTSAEHAAARSGKEASTV